MIKGICEWILAANLLGAAAAAPVSLYPPAPEWAQDLVIYEIATKAFTSPNGPESGTFESLQAKLPYLPNLGISGIWLTGHSVSDPKHFYNIWTQYAAIEPDQLDPSLGTPEQFKAMIDEAHRRGIKVFLDVITHGVMPESTLVKHHPYWFRGGSWGMVDYDWKGGHTDLDDWWVKLWTSYVTDYGIDGFRLDLFMDRPDLWARIRQNASAAAHPIVIFAEGSPAVPGVSDFMQKGNVISNQVTGELSAPFMEDIPQLYRKKFSQGGDYSVTIQYADKSKAEGSTLGQSALPVKVLGFTANRISHQASLPSGQSEAHLIVGNISNGAIENIVVTRLDDAGPAYPRRWEYGPSVEARLKMEGSPPVIDLYLSYLYSHDPSVQLSCHDNGWTGFPPGKSPYAAQGSRATFGYSFLFTPLIPIFMSGEEFDADYHALPQLSPDLYGGKNPGKGRWLYGAQLDWSELERPRHRAMFEDVKRMLAIRKQERAVLAAEIHGEIEPRLIAVPYQSNVDVPVPYMRWNESTAIIIAANRDTEKDADLRLDIPLEKLGVPSNAKYRVTDLWNAGETKVYSAAQLQNFSLRIKRDKSPLGGLAIFKISVVSGVQAGAEEAFPTYSRSRDIWESCSTR